MQAINDLRWLLLAPPLINPDYPRFADAIANFSHTQKTAITAWLPTVVPAHLQAFLETRPIGHRQRLGRYAETLLEYFLRNGPTHELLAANLPIRADRKENRTRNQLDHTTVGEIDYLVRDRCDPQDVQRHWELAVKYFLCRSADDLSPANFMGPDSIEVFEEKLIKLFDRQLRHTPPAPWDTYVWRRQAYTRGWIFYPITSPDLQPVWLHPNHPRGVWLHHENIDQYLPEADYVVLDKQRWLAQANASEQSGGILNRSQAREIISYWWAEARPGQRWPSGILVARLGGGGLEAQRIFVVPNHWGDPAWQLSHQ